ncbi:uncharacterized protein LOC117120910 [Anneissia japonica]|uniref:uncharacterized protein LOC117120910 n=1 Tax=Anneissia japonica TaxID=1529436 RepID=UPI0014255117|nr:uncharacterized protein LOC117120910 [Anneissia japonica]XP_033121897.1 uncharacterized protein LOC117120910 [Anneissia japonica]
MSVVETQLNDLAVTVKDVPKRMRVFSLCMRSLYAETALSGSSDTTRKINKIRDDTRKDALVYVKGVLPASTMLVRNLKDFFENYEALGFEDWKEILPDILEDVKGYQQCCVEIVELHKKIMTPLKERQDEAKVLVAELKNLTKELEKKKRELEESAQTKSIWAAALFFVPVVNVVATPLLCKSADDDLVNSVAKNAQCVVNNAAVVVISEAMIPALAEFIGGLESIAGFFKVVEEELTTFHNRGEMAMEDAKKQHYLLMKNEAKEIRQGCREFFAMIPGITTDFECIPQSGNDENYVDRWLKKQQEEIKEKYTKCLTGKLRRMLTYFSTAEGEKLMIKGKD